MSQSKKSAPGRVVIVGFGNMGRALARGLLKAGKGQVIACERPGFAHPGDFPLPEGTEAARFRLLSVGDAQPGLPVDDPRELHLTEADTVVLCTKPQDLKEVGRIWAPAFVEQGAKPLVISILAGVPTELVHKHVARNCAVVRAMPNIAANVDAAATALCASARSPAEAAHRAQEVFDCVGKSWVVREDQLNAVTGLSGSGPAYIYMIIEALSDGGVKMGLPRQLALDLAAQTVLGAAKLVQETRLHPAILRDQVTTPGGTTISAIHELERHGLRPMLMSAVVTATERSKELAQKAEEG